MAPSKTITKTVVTALFKTIWQLFGLFDIAG
jgi:hypothetical protein